MVRAVPKRVDARLGMKAADSSEIEVKGSQWQYCLQVQGAKAIQVILIISAGDHPSEPSNIEDQRDGSGREGIHKVEFHLGRPSS